MHETPSPRRPLEGVRVVECGVWHAGPGAGAILGDLGAEVIKVESLAGDPERLRGQFGPFGIGASGPKRPDWCLLFEISNRNKRGLALDIAVPEGRRILDLLLDTADVFLTNLRPSTKVKLGIDFDALHGRYPRLVHVNVSSYGPDGPMADLGGFDSTGQAIAGMMFLAGHDEPQPVQVIVLDQMTAITASHAAVTALFDRERTGIGQDVHVSLYGAALWLTYGNLVKTGVSGADVDVSWDRLRNPYSRTTFKCGDNEWFMVTNHSEELCWRPFCTALALTELLDDPAYQTHEQRSARNAELIAIFDTRLATDRRDLWIERLGAQGIIAAPVNRLRHVLDDEQATASGYVVPIDHRMLGSVKVPGYPVKFGRQEAGWMSPAPLLGEHTFDILTELGLTVDEIAELERSKVVFSGGSEG